jgi:hypothetical protein
MNDNLSELTALFEGCESVHTQMGLDEDTAKAYRFYEGEQWYGLESGSEELPVYNFIAPLVKYKTAMVAMNSMSINYSAPISDEKYAGVCSALSKLAAAKWENLEMDSKCWDAVRGAMIGGDSFAYFYNGDGECQIIDRTDVYLGDESIPDISKQPYIFIRERRSVSELKKQAVENGISEQDAQSIVADEDDEDMGRDKCTSLLYMELVGGDLHFIRFTKDLIYQPRQVIKGLGCYPIAAMVSARRRGSARGAGEVLPLVPNQIEINRNLVRRLLNAKLTAYSRLVYANDRIVNPAALTEVGTAIEVEGGSVSALKDAVSYLTPASMSPDAKNLSDELLSITKELSGAGDAVLGSIDPTQASGTAIIAVRDQAALPLNEQTAVFRRFVEDIARIWYRLWCVYNPQGIEAEGEIISADILGALEPNVRVDVSSANPFSKFAREQALERLFTAGHITFEEYIGSLDDDSSVPKSKLEHIIKNRGGNTDVNRQN